MNTLDIAGRLYRGGRIKGFDRPQGDLPPTWGLGAGPATREERIITPPPLGSNQPMSAATPEPPEPSGECPSCGAAVALDASECPECGELFSLEEFDLDAEVPPAETGRRERILFYLGIILILIGGPGIALGSWLHDWLRIPVGGDAFDVFGQVNRFVAAVGLVVLIVGIILLILSLRMSRAMLESDYEVSAPSSPR